MGSGASRDRAESADVFTVYENFDGIHEEEDSYDSRSDTYTAKNDYKQSAIGKMKPKFVLELELPKDARDIVEVEQARTEIAKQRDMLALIMSEAQRDHDIRKKLINSKLSSKSFKGGMLKGLLRESANFIDNLLKLGYENMSIEDRFEGFRQLRSLLKSPALAVLISRQSAQHTLQKQVDEEDDKETNDYIIGHYASSNGTYDVSLVRAHAKLKLSLAMKKLKSQLMLAQVMATQDSTQKRRRAVSVLATSNIGKSMNLSEERAQRLEVMLMSFGEQNYDFDVWDLLGCTNNQVLLATGMELFKLHTIDTRMNVADETICRFFAALESGYNSNNPYHNAVHGADVMYTLSVYITSSSVMQEVLQVTDIFAALIAAAAHDFRHDGFNNAFHVNTRSDLALRYNDISVLENMHAAELFLMCKKDKNVDIFAELEPAMFKEVRKIITSSILSTDMTKHFNHLADFQSRLAAEAAILENPGSSEKTEQRLDKYIMVEMALHCADISNPTKTINIYQNWVFVVMEEFYVQGDAERNRGMTISPMFDRNNSSVTKTQGGFIEFIVRPIFKIWSEFIPSLAEDFTTNLNAGKAFGWDEWYKEEKETRNIKKLAESIAKAAMDDNDADGLSEGRKARNEMMHQAGTSLENNGDESDDNDDDYEDSTARGTDIQELTIQELKAQEATTKALNKQKVMTATQGDVIKIMTQGVMEKKRSNK